MKYFFHKYVPYVVLAACVLVTLAFERNEDPPLPSTAREASAMNALPKHFAGEALPLRAYLPDEAVWNENLGMWQTHDGLDIACEGDFCAPADGTVNRIYTDPLWGICMDVDMGGETLILRSLGSVCEEEGEIIRAGDIIGTPGCAPCEADMGVHVHMEYLRGAVSCDPALLYRAQNQPF